MQKYPKNDLKKRLTPMQYKVTQEKQTQPAYQNEYYLTKDEGIYHCIVCNIPLFSSAHKYDSGCGWPAFNDELKDANIKKIREGNHGTAKTQVRCSQCDSHLGHLFVRPSGKNAIRYCINSASIILEAKNE